MEHENHSNKIINGALGTIHKNPEKRFGEIEI